MESESSLNAKMFEDNFNNLDYQGNPHEIIHNEYENIFSNEIEPEIYEYGSILGMEDEPCQNYF